MRQNPEDFYLIYNKETDEIISSCFRIEGMIHLPINTLKSIETCFETLKERNFLNEHFFIYRLTTLINEYCTKKCPTNLTWLINEFERL